MARVDDLLSEALMQLPEKPVARSRSAKKKAYSESMSAKVALSLAEELRKRGLAETRPTVKGIGSSSGAERRMAGGLGAKKVDVTWATEESGLLLAISVKTINFKDAKTGNYQKNLVNRRGDMLMEAVTLHRRFPYAVLAGFFFLDAGAALDNTARRRSTFENAHRRLRLFTERNDPAGREEQFERFYLLLVEASPEAAKVRAYAVGHPERQVPLEEVMTDLLDLVAQRNPDFYELTPDGRLIRAS